MGLWVLSQFVKPRSYDDFGCRARFSLISLYSNSVFAEQSLYLGSCKVPPPKKKKGTTRVNPKGQSNSIASTLGAKILVLNPKLNP